MIHPKYPSRLRRRSQLDQTWRTSLKKSVPAQHALTSQMSGLRCIMLKKTWKLPTSSGTLVFIHLLLQIYKVLWSNSAPANMEMGFIDQAAPRIAGCLGFIMYNYQLVMTRTSFRAPWLPGQSRMGLSLRSMSCRWRCSWGPPETGSHPAKHQRQLQWILNYM